MQDGALGDELAELIDAAIDLGLDEVGADEPFIPFVMVESQEGRAIYRIVAGNRSDGLAAVAQAAFVVCEHPEAERAAFAWAGRVEGGGADDGGSSGGAGTQLDAVCVIAQERAWPRSILAAQRYVIDGARVLEPAPAAVLDQRAEPLFGVKPPAPRYDDSPLSGRPATGTSLRERLLGGA